MRKYRYLRAFQHRNYRLFYGGQGASLVGMWLQWTAQSWLIFRLTESAAWVGLSTLAMQGPGLFLGPIVGALADRHDKRRILVLAQAAAMAPAVAMGVLTLAGVIAPWHVIGLALFSGVARAFEIPTRQAFIPDLVAAGDLPNAIALNSALFNGARLVGPALAGVAIPWVGEGWCFVGNGATYVLIVAALLAIRLPPRPPRARRGTSLVFEIREGLRYVLGDPTMLSLMGGVLALSAAGQPYAVLLPSFASRNLGGGPETYSYLQVAVGLGALSGAAALAVRTRVRGLERWAALAGVLFGLVLVAFSQARTVAVALVLLVPLGFCFMIQIATTNTLLQTLVPNHLRGRVMSLHTTIFLGVFPLAGLLAGTLADRFGEVAVLMGGGVLMAGGVAACGRVFVRHAPEALAARAQLMKTESPSEEAGKVDAMTAGDASS